MALRKILLVFCLLFVSVSAFLTNYSGTENLHSWKYSLSWNINPDNNTIHFTVVAKTRGYVGFGLSPNGGMKNADIFIAGVFPNGTVYSGDYHGIGHSIPVLDSQQNWILTGASENFTHTEISFYRQLDTCDPRDFKITEDTMHVIWALGQTDNLEHHSYDRGTESLDFYSNDDPGFNKYQYASKEITVTMEMPAEETTYWCTIHELPKLDRTHHIVHFEPVLNSLDALKYTHHFIIYQCQIFPWEEKWFANLTTHPGDLCYGDQQTIQFKRHCLSNPVYAWSKGGKPLSFPENVGLPIQETRFEREFWALEIHYDNPQRVSGKSFKTGARFYYTDNLREQEAGLMRVEHKTGVELTIPPNSKDFVVSGHCSGECTQAAFPPGGINIVGVLLHSHLAGRKLKLRHFRGSQELEWIAKDDHYDFDFQQMRMLSESRKVLPGDQMTVECTYETGARAVLGGLSAREEMCQAWFYYYPKHRSYSICGSGQNREQHFNLFGIKENLPVESCYPGGLGMFVVTKPDNWLGKFYSHVVSYNVNWTESFRASYQQKKRFDIQDVDCSMGVDWYVNRVVSYPENLQEYREVNQCQANGAN